ncbi:hypothetical protein ACS3QZ_01320 [Shimia sp. W99]
MAGIEFFAKAKRGAAKAGQRGQKPDEKRAEWVQNEEGAAISEAMVIKQKPDRFFNLSGMTNPVNLPIARTIGQVRWEI